MHVLPLNRWVLLPAKMNGTQRRTPVHEECIIHTALWQKAPSSLAEATSNGEKIKPV